MPSKAMSDEDFLAEMDRAAATRPDYLSGALNGVLYGLAYGFLAGKPSHGNRLKYAAYGAAGVVSFQFFAQAFLKKADVWAHEHVVLPTPPSPIVTKGHFAGMPRMMYHADDSGSGGESYVGAGPSIVGAGPAAPNNDYSFTRRPGFNDKNY
jgi:hypothetical protein